MAFDTIFGRALEVGRPPTIKKLFPNSRALLVSGKVIDRALRKKGNAMTMAANGRNAFVIRGALKAAQRANAALIIEIAKSESNYCPVNFWNIARQVDAACNELGITIPVAIHADHYGLKSDADVEAAKVEIPTIFEAGITSIAIDASHMVDDKNLLANLDGKDDAVKKLTEAINNPALLQAFASTKPDAAPESGGSETPDAGTPEGGEE